MEGTSLHVLARHMFDDKYQLMCSIGDSTFTIAYVDGRRNANIAANALNNALLMAYSVAVNDIEHATGIDTGFKYDIETSGTDISQSVRDVLEQ